MKLTGFLLWLGMSALSNSTATILFKFSIFQKDKIWKFKTSDVKLVTIIILSELVMITYVHLNSVLGIFGYFGIFIYPIEDGILSGLLVTGGADFLYQLYQTMMNYKGLLQAKKELIDKAKAKEGDA